MSSEDKYSGKHDVTFSYTAWHERVWTFLKLVPVQIPLFAAVAISFWGVAEVLAEIGGERLSLKDLALPALATAFVVAIYKSVQRYRLLVPDAIALESSEVKKIYKKGRSGWQFSMARMMLLNRVGPVNRTLRRVDTGAEFIAPQFLSRDEYIAWLKRRPDVLLRLLHAVAVQCTQEFPSVLAVTRKEEHLVELKAAVEQLSHLYSEAASLELEVRRVMPPKGFESVHRMTFRWTDPIRGGIEKFLDILDQISNIDVKRVMSGIDRVPALSIEFESPKNIDEFIREMEGVDLSALE